MKTETKVLIVMIIMIFSVGPLTFFFPTGPEQIDLPDENDDTPLFYTLSGNVSGSIVELQPLITYIGFSTSNNELHVKSIIDSLNYTTNYSSLVSLNPQGPGFRYEIVVGLENISDAKEIGFRIHYRLSPFFYDSTPPIMIGKILFPTSFVLGENSITADENETGNILVLYSNNMLGKQITVYCPQLITSLNYKLVRIPKLCIDMSSGVMYGLSLSDFLLYQRVKEKEMNLSVESIKSINVDASFEYGLNVTSEELQPFFPGSEVNIQFATNESPGSVTVALDPEGEATTDNVEVLLRTVYRMTITDVYKVGLVDLPSEVTLDGETYELFAFDKGEVRLEMPENTGIIKADVRFTTIFKEITNVRITKK